MSGSIRRSRVVKLSLYGSKLVVWAGRSIADYGYDMHMEHRAGHQYLKTCSLSKPVYLFYPGHSAFVLLHIVLHAT